jgi:hypothetical protein
MAQDSFPDFENQEPGNSFIFQKYRENNIELFSAIHPEPPAHLMAAIIASMIWVVKSPGK